MVAVADGVLLCGRRLFFFDLVEQSHCIVEIVQYLGVNLGNVLTGQGLIEGSDMGKDGNTYMGMIGRVIVRLRVGIANVEHCKGPRKISLGHDLTHGGILRHAPSLMQVLLSVIQYVAHLGDDRPSRRPVFTRIGGDVLLFHLIVEKKAVTLLGGCGDVQEVSGDFGVFDAYGIEGADFGVHAF